MRTTPYQADHSPRLRPTTPAYHSTTLRDAAALAYLAKRAGERAQREAQQRPLAIAGAGSFAFLILGGILITTAPNANTAHAGLASCLIGLAALLIIAIASPAP